MKKVLHLITGFCALIICTPVFAQDGDLPVYHIDRTVRAYTATSPAMLVKGIITANENNLKKVTAIFRWITDNISYNVRAAGRNKNSYMMYEEAEDDTGKLIKPLNLRVAETVVKRKEAVCDGYARLFKTMCDYAGIPCKIITGYARGGWYKKWTGFISNHSWNAVYIDSAWHLLDATWASGYTNFKGDEFTRRYDDRYFLTPPEQFMQDHYPEDTRWTLLKDPPLLNEFNHSPLRYLGFIKMGIHSFLPPKGIIEAAVGDSIRFEADASIEQGLLEVVSGTQPIDTIWNDNEPVIFGGKKKSFTYVVTENTSDWLYVICNGFVVLRYKLNIRIPENKMASLKSY